MTDIDSYGEIIRRVAADIAVTFPERSTDDCEAIASMGVSLVLQHGFTPEGFQQFERWCRFEA
jgi:hypothetical protein